MKTTWKNCCRRIKETHPQLKQQGSKPFRAFSSSSVLTGHASHALHTKNDLEKQEGPTNQKSFLTALLNVPREFLKRMSKGNISESARKFKKTLRESLTALGFNLVGILAGAVMAYNAGLFQLAPWVILVYPQIISARGVIGGLFCGRLSTALHLGTVQPRLRGNTKSFRLLFRAIVILTLEASVAMSLVAMVFGSVLLGVAPSDFPSILCVIIATMALALLVVSPLTVTVSFISFKRGLDPDIVLYPIESTVSDFFITIIYILVVNSFLQYGVAGQLPVILTGLILIIVSASYLSKYLKEPEFTKTIRESLLSLVFVAFIVNVTGSTLGKISEFIGGRREIYTVYPAMIDTMGDVGAVTGSTATTKLALGTLKPSLSSIASHKIEISGVWVASIIMFLIYSVSSLIIQGLLSPFTLLRFTALLVIANLIAGSVIVIVSYFVAIVTYRRGLDPDNFVIPIESSLADSITTLSLLVALGLFG